MNAGSRQSRRPTCRVAAVAALAMTSLVRPPMAVAQPAEAPSRAMLFVRVIGDVDPMPGQEARLLTDLATLRQSNVELATGSGFLVSPVGYILTNHHLVSETETTETFSGVEISLKTRVKTIEVLLPQELVARTLGVSSADIRHPSSRRAPILILPFCTSGDRVSRIFHSAIRTRSRLGIPSPRWVFRSGVASRSPRRLPPGRPHRTSA